jgi:hypothetical protein
MLDEKEEEIEEEEEEEYVEKKRKTRNGSAKKKRKVIVEDESGQTICCILNCENTVVNRLRFSLRQSKTFKENFLDQDWHKVCEYCYFNDRYEYNKQHKALH